MMIAILWSPDGKHIAFVSNRTEDPDANSNTDIWVVDANNPNKDKKLTQVTTNPNSDNLLLGVQMENILPM
jgi:Tol biopolymer transport system component